VLHTPNKSPIATRLFWSLPALVLGLILSGCATKNADTNKTSPAPQSPPANSSAAPSANSTQRLDTKLNIQFDWWKLLQSPQLNSLIEQAFAANPTVADAQNTLLKAQQSDIIRLGYFHAAISIGDAANGQGRLIYVQEPTNLSDAKFIGDSYYNLHAQQLAVGYLPEMLRISEPMGSSITEAELRQLQMEATYRTLASNLIACALQEASLRTQMAAARKVAAIDQSLLAIARKQQKVGLVMQADVAVKQAAAAQSEQALLLIKGQFEQMRELLHVLLGIPPEVNLPESFELASLHLSEDLPLELPVALVEQRPDVRAAQLEMLPAMTRYQSTINAALKNTEDTLLAIYSGNIALKAASAAEQDHMAALASARKQYAAKEVNYQDVDRKSVV
jgi:outer membrane protein TolC